MLKTVLKIDGMMCGMCESHMNDLIRKHCKVKKVSSSAKKGETVVISEEALIRKFRSLRNSKDIVIWMDSI